MVLRLGLSAGLFDRIARPHSTNHPRAKYHRVPFTQLRDPQAKGYVVCIQLALSEYNKLERLIAAPRREHRPRAQSISFYLSTSPMLTWPTRKLLPRPPIIFTQQSCRNYSFLPTLTHLVFQGLLQPDPMYSTRCPCQCELEFRSHSRLVHHTCSPISNKGGLPSVSYLCTSHNFLICICMEPYASTLYYKAAAGLRRHIAGMGDNT
ncbi:hypothetical protein L211DRAFT_213911 [Terfezia boudieri ATCC MYA-4762]|uniref:Uncharacterized protein n=1 Tax=Terfezia boudieri ATCC MYA-4762 TaxID=1051890 RepID=A0A3N4LMN2_9PEZI|nr:hypothetical protein L211DRAFT_213911 [Terfezia boudieri ATCC MYA-4762]